MTNRKAIEILREKISLCVTGEWKESVDAAIAALQAQDVSPTNVGDTISRQAAIDVLDAYQVMIENGEENPYAWARLRMSELPSAQPEIIRCKDCKWWSNDDYRECSSPNYDDGYVTPAGFYCGYAERRTDELGDS